MKRRNGASTIDKEQEAKKKERHYYTDVEITKILEYMRDTIASGRQIEKPNARQYYSQLIEKSGLQNFDNISLINKVGKLKDTYDQVIKWRNETGQGVDDESVRDHTLKICKYYDLLDEIFGGRVTFHVPYSSETTEVGPDEAVYDLVRSDGTQPREKADDKPPIEFIKESATTMKPKKKQSDFVIATLKRVEVRLAETEVEKQRIKMESEKLKLDTEFHADKISLEKQKLEMERDVLKENRQIENLKMEFESRKLAMEEQKSKLELKSLEDEIQFKREKLNKEIDLEKFKITENVRLQIELAKLKK